MQKVILKKSDKKDKKLKVTFADTNKTVYFGAQGYSDYTKHKDFARMKRYEARHKKKEDWNNPLTAGFWSKWILWNKPDLQKSIKDTQKKFNLKIVQS